MPGRAAPPRTRVPLLERVVDLGSAATMRSNRKSDSPVGGDHARFFLSGLVASGVKPPEVLSCP